MNNMKKIGLLLAMVSLLVGCSKQEQSPIVYESENLKIEKVTDHIYVHVSYLQTEDFGKVGCNGMIYINGEEAIVFDTTVDDESSKELIDWIQDEQKKTIKAVVTTHFHHDCLGGLQAFHDRQVDSYANVVTLSLLAYGRDGTDDIVFPNKPFYNRTELQVGGETVVLDFFGEGHTKDNVVGYIPSEKALFGGCLVKSLKAGKGNLEDANVAAWPSTIKKIKRELPDLEIVIPGHGKHGGSELLDRTIEIFSE